MSSAIWIKFFTNAGLPSQVSAGYAHIFAENRIQMDMLMDLNKEYLREMNITTLGDIIAILRHAKVVYDQSTREKVLSTQTNEVKIATVNPVVERKTEIVPDKISRNLKSMRRVYTEEDDKIQAKTMRIQKDNCFKGVVNPKKATIFTRLSDYSDDEKNKTKTTEIPSVVVTSNTFKSVFNRLGEKQEIDKETNDGINILTKKSVEKTILPLKNDSKAQKVILVQRVPAKAIFHEESKSRRTSQAHIKSPREKSVSFSEKDEILEIQRHETFDIKNRLGVKKINKDGLSKISISKLHGRTSINLRSTRNSTANKPSTTKMKSDILLSEKHIPIQKRLTLRKDKSRSINSKQTQRVKSVFKRIG